MVFMCFLVVAKKHFTPPFESCGDCTCQHAFPAGCSYLHIRMCLHRPSTIDPIIRSLMKSTPDTQHFTPLQNFPRPLFSRLADGAKSKLGRIFWALIQKRSSWSSNLTPFFLETKLDKGEVGLFLNFRIECRGIYLLHDTI